MTATEHPVEMDHVVATPVRGCDDRFRLGHGYKTLPTDLPAYLYVTRHMSTADDAAKPSRPAGLLGWTLAVELLGFELDVRVKIVHGGVAQVLVGGVEVALLQRKG